MENEKKKLRLSLNRRYCKGCGICIRNCPAQALTPDADGKPLFNGEKCIRCMLCEIHCPDFAIRFAEQ